MSKALTINDAARALGVSRTKMFELLAQGRIGYVRIANRLRVVPVSEIERFLASQIAYGGGDAA